MILRGLRCRRESFLPGARRPPARLFRPAACPVADCAVGESRPFADDYSAQPHVPTRTALLASAVPAVALQHDGFLFSGVVLAAGLQPDDFTQLRDPPRDDYPAAAATRHSGLWLGRGLAPSDVKAGFGWNPQAKPASSHARASMHVDSNFSLHSSAQLHDPSRSALSARVVPAAAPRQQRFSFFPGVVLLRPRGSTTLFSCMIRRGPAPPPRQLPATAASASRSAYRAAGLRHPTTRPTRAKRLNSCFPRRDSHNLDFPKLRAPSLPRACFPRLRTAFFPSCMIRRGPVPPPRQLPATAAKVKTEGSRRPTSRPARA